MNNNRYIASFYYPSATDAAMETVAPTPSMADIPPAYLAAATQQQELLQLDQQKAYLSARQPPPAPVSAPVQVHGEIAEEAPVPYVEPIYSTYAGHDSAIPVYYRMATSVMAPPTQKSVSLSTQKSEATVVEETVQHAKMEEVNQLANPMQNAVPLDYFMRNKLPKESTEASIQPAEVHVAPSEVRLDAVIAPKGYQKMQNAFGEDASAYAFEAMDEKLFTENYNTLDNVPAFTPQTRPSEALVATPNPSVDQAVQYSRASFPQSSFNQKMLSSGGYNAEESTYLSFKNDVHAAYGQKTGSIQYNYGQPPAYSMVSQVKMTAVIQETANQEETVKTAGSASTASVEKSRFNAAIEESMANLEEQEEAQEQQIDLRKIGNAFRPAMMNAESQYQFDNLNDLVSCIQIN